MARKKKPSRDLSSFPKEGTGIQRRKGALLVLMIAIHYVHV